MLTYKELAERLGVKKDTVIYRARKLPADNIIKKNNKNYLTEAAVKTITNEIKKQQQASHNATDLLAEQLTKKDEQLKSMQKLLDQSQQLQLMAEKKIEEFKSITIKKDDLTPSDPVGDNNTLNKKNAWWHFWK
ncbi:DUF536 domain-containing protein [Lactiplantibacillus plantarum]|uniref:DUF536 domain-containing protein n=1 Tax=Lactiplantibacillus plantarum TaxID=1590 RepID=UPI003C14C1FC